MMRNKLFILCVVAFILLSGGFIVYAQFFIDDNNTDIKTSPGLPAYVARSIKAELIDGVEGAVRIVFSVDPNSKCDFLLGRTTRVPSTPEVALQATTVKVILAGAEPVAIDSNLPPGQYYYVVLARDKIIERDIVLYPDVNYTSAPIVIKKRIPQLPAKRLYDHVTLLYARIVNKTQVLLTWKGIQQPNIVYNVYRATEPLNSPEKIKNARLIGEIQSNEESFIDRTIAQTGKYYYAVTVKDMEGNEDIQLIPDQSYTSAPVSVIFRRDVFVTGIKATLDNDYLKVSWNKPDIDVKNFVIYRHTEPITDAQDLALATKVATVDAKRTQYIDTNPISGTYYFAVLAILEDGSIDTTLRPDMNYTTVPIMIGHPISLKLLEAIEQNGLVKISWAYTGSSGNRYFKLFRLRNAPFSVQDLNNAYLVDVINITNNEYIDSNIPAGSYYYALVPETYDNELKIIKGVNCTAESVKVTKMAKAQLDLQDPEKEKTGKSELPESQKEEARSYQLEKQKLSATADINKIIAITFYKGKYETCIDTLSKYSEQSKNSIEIAKANLYIGRSYIELKQYKKALHYLMKKDVATYFPEDTQFWRDFAIARSQ
ncbi:MAG TPA: hypothetical protein PLZ38_12685 [Spirochaetota bacterium]|nr:hypothetical protein [Spirochaetota bacterium]